MSFLSFLVRFLPTSRRRFRSATACFYYFTYWEDSSVYFSCRLFLILMIRPTLTFFIFVSPERFSLRPSSARHSVCLHSVALYSCILFSSRFLLVNTPSYVLRCAHLPHIYICLGFSTRLDSFDSIRFLNVLCFVACIYLQFCQYLPTYVLLVY